MENGTFDHDDFEMKWRMRSITPFNFIDYFVYMVEGTKSISISMIARVNHVSKSLSTVDDYGIQEACEGVAWLAKMLAMEIKGTKAHMPIDALLHFTVSRICEPHKPNQDKNFSTLLGAAIKVLLASHTAPPSSFRGALCTALSAVIKQQEQQTLSAAIKQVFDEEQQMLNEGVSDVK
eukprot:Gb_29763 [translate_table: standard]